MDETIRDWLAKIDLAHLAPVFEQAEIGPRDLRLLEEADLKELGLALGPRKRVLHAIAAMQELGKAAARPASPPDAHKAEAERRQLTVMFCDLVGSTELSRRLDPEDLRTVMQSYQDAVVRAVGRYGGYLAKHLGDGLLIYFGWPRAHEKAVEGTVRAGLDAVRSVASVDASKGRRLDVRIGIATGRVVVGDMVGEAGREAQAISGAAPNLSARLQQLAAPGQVVIDQASLDLIGTRVELLDLGEQLLKGFDEPIRAYAVLSLDPVGVPDPAREPARTPFLGRTPELELMLDRWQRAREGEGQIVLVSGEAGIGKSRLLEAFVARLDRAAHALLRFQCSAYGADEALYPVTQHYLRSAGIEASDETTARLDKLERLLAVSGVTVSATAPFLARLLLLPADDRYGSMPMSAEQRKERTFGAVLDYFDALVAQGPVLMLFEDAHWIDPTTSELLETAAAMIVNRPVLLVVSHRPEWQAAFHAAPHVTPIALSRLGRGQSSELVRAAGGGALPADVFDQIVARTDGIPLFLEELTRSVLEAGSAAAEIPTTLEASLHARLDRLGPAKHIAQVGSVIGREFGHSLLAAVAGLADDELASGLQQLVDSELFFRQGRPPETSYAFKHALVQEAAYRSLLRSRRRALHAEVARALAKTGPGRPSLMAHHWERAEEF
jgi:class 3 adenylate cyclase